MEIIKRQFKTPLQIGTRLLHEKEFIISTIDCVDFELSVLPGLHAETLQHAWEQCQSVLPSLRASSGALDDTKPFFGLIDSRPLCPSAMFALESWLFRRADLQKHSPWNLPVELNALLWRPSLDELTLKRAQGFKTFKLKISRGESAKDIDNFFAALWPHERIRLDGNRRLSPDQLAALLAPLKPYWQHIDYIEEPFASVSELNDWDHPLPLAWDESAALLMTTTLPKNIAALVIKPSLWGFTRTLNAIKKFNHAGLKVTLSSAYEGEIGLEAITALASFQNSLQPNPAGLDTSAAFK